MILWDRLDYRTKQELRKGLCYLATPYSFYPGGRNKAFRAAATINGELHNHGIDAYSAIAHGHPMTLYAFCEWDDHARWAKLNGYFIDSARCLLIAKMIDWPRSQGVARERAAFERMSKPEFFIEVEGA